MLENSGDVYAEAVSNPELLIKTHYESLDIAQSNRIHYLCFLLDKPIPVEKDEILKQLLSEPEND